MVALLCTSRECTQDGRRVVAEASRTITQLRRRQLELALAGRIIESARCAEQVRKLLQSGC